MRSGDVGKEQQNCFFSLRLRAQRTLRPDNSTGTLNFLPLGNLAMTVVRMGHPLRV